MKKERAPEPGGEGALIDSVGLVLRRILSFVLILKTNSIMDVKITNPMRENAGFGLPMKYKIRNIISDSRIFVLYLHMRIFTEQRLNEYIQQHPETRTALQEWKYVVRHSEWHSYADVKKSFNTVDAVGNQRYVFDIMGNKHRIVIVIKFTIYFVYIRFIGSHAEYDKMNKTIGAKYI